MKAPRTDEHRWARVRLAAFASGLLDGSDEERLCRHAGECAECRADVDDSMPGAPDPGRGHIPAGIVASWDRARLRLRGLERTLVRRHLERCDECRQDLEALGFAPMLDVVPELESVPMEGVLPIATGPTPDDAGPGLAADDGRATVRPVIRILRGSESRPSNPRREGILFAWATLATAAAAALVVVPLVTHLPVPRASAPPAPGMSAPLHPEATPTRAPQFPLRLAVLDDAHTIRSALRGGDSVVSTIPITASTRYLSLALPPLFAPESASATIEIIGADGLTLARVEARLGEIRPRHALLLASDARPIPAGHYTLRFTTPPESRSPLTTPEVADYRFELRAVKPPAGPAVSASSPRR